MTTIPHPPHPLATLPQIVTSPSKRDGLPRDVEADLRVGGCMLIQEAGIMLELQVGCPTGRITTNNRPQSTMATAQVLFHRFFYVSSMLSFSVNVRVWRARVACSRANG